MGRAVSAAFFLSGVAGLMHQVVWAKLLVQLVGATAHAQAVVLAVFLGGLAIGAVTFGRWVDRHGRPLRAYVHLELAIGTYCLLLPLLLSGLTGLYVALAALVFESGAPAVLLRASLAALAVLAPAVLMGGTLPVLARHLIGRIEDIQRRVAYLYALNSCGAVLGAGLAGFVTLPAVGVYGSLALASAGNLAAAAVVLAQARRTPVPPVAVAVPRRAAPPPYTVAHYTTTLAALGVSGFAAMGYEVLFTRLIGLAFGSSTYSFTVMLMAFITGIALGSAMLARRTVRRPLWWLATSQIAVAVALLGVTPFVSRLAYFVGLVRIAVRPWPWGFELDLVGKALLCLAILLVPTTCLGVAFPLVAQVQARSPAEIGTRVGSTYAWNTIGNILGVLVTTLVLIPGLGIEGAYHVNVALSALAGLALLCVADTAPRWRVALAGATAAVAALYVTAGTGWSEPIRYAVRHLRLTAPADAGLSPAERARHPSASFAAWRAEYMYPPSRFAPAYFEEDAHATVLAFTEDGQTYLNVNGKPDASSTGDMITQLLLGHAPLLVAPQARTALVIGYGSGVTVGAALRHPLERVDVAEISPAVLHADRVFADLNHHALADPRLHVYADDGLSFLRTSPRRYDLVISEPSNPWIAGIGNLFTAEFFTAVREHLAPGGVFACWLHTYEQSDANVALIVRTLDAVFPHALWFTDDNFGNEIAVASADPIAIDFDLMERRYATVADDLARIDVPNLVAFLAYQRLSAETLRSQVEPGPLNTIANARLEYAAPRSLFQGDISHLLDRLDPFRQHQPADGALLVDRFLAHRAATNRPVPAGELTAAARYFEGFELYAAAVGASLRARLDPPP